MGQAILNTATTITPANGLHRLNPSAAADVTASPLSMPGVALLILLSSFLFIGVRGLWEPDEGRYTAVATKILDTGDWFHLQLHYEHPHYTKPPVTYWAIALSAAAFGRSEWAARLPGAVAFGLTAVVVGFMAHRLVPGRGRLAAAMYATTALPFIASNFITTDTILTLWQALAMLGLVCAWPRLDQPIRCETDNTAYQPIRQPLHLPWLLLMWLAFVLAFMTKGPPALLPILPAAITLGYVEGRCAAARLFHPIGLLLFLLVGCSWYLYIAASTPGMMTYFIHDEVYARVLTSDHGRNTRWYKAFMYLPVLAVGLLPWSLAWLKNSAFWKVLLHPIRALKTDPPGALLCLWLLIPLLIFMLSQSRLPLYVLPLVTPLVILTARVHGSTPIGSRSTWTTLGLALGLLVAVRLGLAVVPAQQDSSVICSELPLSDEVHEIVYVGVNPRRALYYYTDREVEQVTLRPDDQELESLDSELRDDQTCLLLVVSPRAYQRVCDALDNQHWTVQRQERGRDGWYLVVMPPA